MARWDHSRWAVADHPFVDGNVLTVGFATEARTSSRGSTYRGYRIDVGASGSARGNAFVDRGRIAIRFDAPFLGIERVDFAVDAEARALPGTGRMMRGGRWEPLPTLPPT